MPRTKVPRVVNRKENPLKGKVDEIRRRLTRDLTHEELSSMQLQLDVLEKWARLANATDADHQHNHMNDHDNTAFAEPFVVLGATEKVGRES